MGPKALQKLVDTFNKKYPVGTLVMLRTDSGEIETTVMSPAFVFCGHSAVAHFHGISGCYSIEDKRVRPTPTKPATASK